MNSVFILARYSAVRSKPIHSARTSVATENIISSFVVAEDRTLCRIGAVLTDGSIQHASASLSVNWTVRGGFSSPPQSISTHEQFTLPAPYTTSLAAPPPFTSVCEASRAMFTEHSAVFSQEISTLLVTFVTVQFVDDLQLIWMRDQTQLAHPHAIFEWGWTSFMVHVRAPSQ